MATNAFSHRPRSWKRLCAGSRAESSPPIDVRAAVYESLYRMTDRGCERRSFPIDTLASWKIVRAIAGAVCAIAVVGIFVLRDAPSFLSDPLIFFLINR